MTTTPNEGKAGSLFHTVWKRLADVAPDLLGVVFWTYALVKLFVLDVDLALFQRFAPSYLWILKTRFLLFIGFVAIVWLFTRNTPFLLSALYVAFYPLVVLLWKIPWLIYRQQSWIITLASIHAAISFFRSLKYTFISSSFLLIGVFVAVYATNRILLTVSAIGLLILLASAYWRRLTVVFKPSTIYQLYAKVFGVIRAKGMATYALDAEMKLVPHSSLNDKQLEKFTSNLQIVILFQRLTLLISKRLQEYQSSRVTVVAYMFGLIVLVAITVLVFAAVNLTVYKVNAAAFDAPHGAGLFLFIYYSLNAFLFNSIREVTPIAPVSHTVLMVEQFFAFSLVAILISILFGIRMERQSEDLKEAITRLQRESETAETFIRDEYGMTMPEAMHALERAKAGLIAVIYKLTSWID